MILFMKKLLGIIVLGLLLSGNAYAEEIYYKCVIKMGLSRAETFLPFEKGEDFGLMYFKLDKKKSKITIHEELFGDKLNKIGIKKIDFVGKSNVEIIVDKPVSGSKWVKTIKLNSWNSFNKQDGSGLILKGSEYINHKSKIYDYDFESNFCVGPLDGGKVLKGKEAKKKYKEWLKP